MLEIIMKLVKKLERGTTKMKSYGEIQAETILNGGTIEEAEEKYNKQMKGEN